MLRPGSPPDLAPFRCLERVSEQGAPAATPLVRWLTRHPWRLPSDRTLAEDILHDVAVRLIETASRLVPRLQQPAHQADRRLVGYVQRMIRNAWLDHCRRRPWVPLEPRHMVGRHDPGLGIDLRTTCATVDAAIERVRRRRPTLGEPIDQLTALARGDITMGGLVDRTRRPDEVATVVRDRLYKRHTRARGAVVDELDALTEEGRIGPDLQWASTRFVHEWFRRRRA